MAKKYYKLIACEVLFREVCAAAVNCRNIIDVSFMFRGLHDIGEEKMVAKIQEEIYKTEPDKYDAILLCYGLCNNGIKGLHAPIPIVVPKAHDCITLFLGSKEKYRKYFDDNPGTYFKTSGWLERQANSDTSPGTILNQMGFGMDRQSLIELYGEDNAEFLEEILNDMTPNYKQMTYIDMGFGMVEEDREEAKRLATKKEWEFEEVKGDNGLVSRLLDGDMETWNEEEFLIVPPGKTIEPSYDDNVIKTK